MIKSKQNKIIIVLIDGLGDISIEEDGKTPLQLTKINNLNRLASTKFTNIIFGLEIGINGMMDPVEPGLACGSDTAHLSILGYDPKMLPSNFLLNLFSWYRGRGSFETLGSGIHMKQGDIAFKVFTMYS